jgi:hypothetical protein
MLNTESHMRLHQEFPVAPPVSRPCETHACYSDNGNWHKPKVGVPRALARLLHRHSRLRMLLSECRNFLDRTRTVLKNTDSYRVPMGFVYLQSPAGRVYPNTRSRGRSECIERLASTRPSATPVDWNLWREAWDQGVEWALHNLGSALTDEHTALLASELTYHAGIINPHAGIINPLQIGQSGGNRSSALN